MMEADKNIISEGDAEDRPSSSSSSDCNGYYDCEDEDVEEPQNKEWSTENWILDRAELKKEAIMSFRNTLAEYAKGYSMTYCFELGHGYMAVSHMLRATRVLELFAINIGDEGFGTIMSSLPANVEFLSFTYCSITGQGAKFMLDFLNDKKSLTYISLAKDNIGDEGFRSLCDLVCRNSNITSLRLSEINISDESTRYANEILKENRNIISLDLLDDPECSHKWSNRITKAGVQNLDELAENSSIIALEYPNKDQRVVELLNARKELVTKLLIRWIGSREIESPYGEIEGYELSSLYLEKLHKYSSSIMDSCNVMTKQVMMRCTNFHFGSIGIGGGYTSGSPYYVEYESRRYENLPTYLGRIFQKDLEEKYAAMKLKGYNFLQHLLCVYGVAKVILIPEFCNNDIVLQISRYLDSNCIKLHDAPVRASIENVQAATQSCTQVNEISNSQQRGI